jgi:hypothetical protein
MFCWPRISIYVLLTTHLYICSDDHVSLYTLVNETNMVHNLFSLYFVKFIYNLYMFWTSPGPLSEVTTVGQPTPYTSKIASMNMAPMKTPWCYSNISTNHHFYHKQLHIQLFHHDNHIIPEQPLNKQNPMFQLLYNRYHTSHPTWHPNQYLHLNIT